LVITIQEKAAYPLEYVADNKFWPSVRRVDETYGDRNLICSCALSLYVIFSITDNYIKCLETIEAFFLFSTQNIRYFLVKTKSIDINTKKLSIFKLLKIISILAKNYL
jgi:hypothetical protein